MLADSLASGLTAAHAVMAAAYGQLGDAEAAGKAVHDLLRLQPGFRAVARKVLEKWWAPEYIDRMIDGWRKAGLEIDGEPERPGLRSVPGEDGADGPASGSGLTVER